MTPSCIGKAQPRWVTYHITWIHPRPMWEVIIYNVLSHWLKPCSRDVTQQIENGGLKIHKLIILFRLGVRGQSSRKNPVFETAATVRTTITPAKEACYHIEAEASCRHFADDIFKCIFLNENIWLSLKISLKFVPKIRINSISAFVQIMAWRRPGYKPSSEILVSLLTHICVSRPHVTNHDYLTPCLIDIIVSLTMDRTSVNSEKIVSALASQIHLKHVDT